MGLSGWGYLGRRAARPFHSSRAWQGFLRGLNPCEEPANGPRFSEKRPKFRGTEREGEGERKRDTERERERERGGTEIQKGRERLQTTLIHGGLSMGCLVPYSWVIRREMDIYIERYRYR